MSINAPAVHRTGSFSWLDKPDDGLNLSHPRESERGEP